MDAGSADARSGMTLRNNGSVIRNSTFFNNFYDILIRGNSSVIDNVTLTGVRGLYTLGAFDCEKNNITNSVLSSGTQGVAIYTCHNNTFENVSMNGPSDRDAFYFESAHGNIIRNATITSARVALNGGALSLSSSDRTLVENVRLTVSNGGKAAYITASTGTVFIDTAFSSGGTGKDIREVDASGSYKTLVLNSTIDPTKVDTGNGVQVFIRNYVNANVTDATGAAISGANVSIRNVTNAEENWSLTSASGLSGIINVTTVVVSGLSDTRTYYTNYSANASKDPYFNNSQTYNVTARTTINLTLATVCEATGQDVTITSSMSCTNANMSFGTLTINAGGRLFLNKSNMNVSGDTTIASGGSLDVFNSKGTVWFSDNVTISGSANFSNATVRMNGTCDGCVRMNVTATGSLIINSSSNITNGATAAAEYLIHIQPGANFTMIDSYLSEAGYTEGAYDYDLSGVYIDGVNASIRNSTFQNNYVHFVLWHADNASVVNNTFLSTDSEYGVYHFFSNFSNYSDNRFILGASAIYMESSSNVSIAHLGLTSSGDDKGLYLVDVNATNGTDINLTMANGADGTGLYLLRSHRNSFNRVRVETQETTSATKGALYLHSSDNNTFNNSYFYAPNLNAVVGDIQVPFPGPAGNVIQDSALFSGEELTDYDVLLDAYTNITLINTSYATNDVSFGTASNLYYKNYLKVGVKDSQNGSLLKFVNVTVMNLSGVEEFNDFTDANGETSFHTLMSWKQNSSGFEYYSNYTMNFSLVEYQNGTGTVNLTGRMIHNVTMSPLCYFNGNAMYLEENLTCENTTGKLSSLEITPFAKLRLVNVSLNISGQIIVRDNAVFDVINASFGKGGIRVAGNISVNGTFNFTDSALGMNLTCASCAAGTERTGLNISGNIIINRSNITKAEPLHENYSFVVYALGNISVQNSRIENAGWASPSAAGDPAGGLLIYANNSLIRNTTFYNNSYDLRLVAANNSFIYNNSFKSPTNGYSVLLYSSSRYNNISNNYFNGSLTAIYLSASDNNSFEQNWMNGSFNGMYFSSSNNNTVKYATIYSAGAGMQFISSGYNHVENVNLSESVNNYGLFLGGNRNYFRDLRVSSRSGNSSAMFINAASTNEVFRSTIESVDTGALVVNRGTSNLFTDVAFTSGPIGYDIEGVYGSGTYYTSLVNCTFNWNDVGSAAGDRIQARDYFNVYVSDNSGALSGVNVSVHNLTYQLENWSLTNSSGLTGVLNYTVFHHINTVRSEYNNYTVLVRKDGYHTRNLSVNVSKGKPYNITMNATPAFLGVVADPSPLGYGYNVTIEVNVTDPDGDTDITSVLVEIDPPGTPVATNQTMTLIEDFGSGLRYRYNHTDWYNGTYNYKIYVKDTTNNWVNSTTYTFDLWTNMSLQTRTVNGSYIRDEIINLTNGTGEDLSVVFNNGSTSTKVYLVMWVQFFNATDLKWYDEALVWNTTWTFNLTAGQNITLANYWNGKVNTSENLTKGSGWYRVNISLHSNSSVILKNYSGYNLSYTYNFSYFNNSLPALKTVQLLPGTAYTTTTLTLYANCTDPDVSDTINAVYTFYKDGVNTSSGAQVVTNGVNTSVGTVAPASTAKGETWTGSVSCKDGTNSTAYTNTSDVLILNSVPTLPVHDSPSTENFTVHERYTFFNWTNSTDDDGDTIVYEINVSTDTACAGGGFNQSWLDRTNTSAPKALCTHDETALIYNWTVRACDDETCTAWTTRWNFSIQPWIVIVFTNDNVDFGEIAFTQVNQWNDTSDDKPLPFTIENTGNVLTNLTNVTANASLWLDPQAGLGTHYFQIKVANTTEADSFDWQASQTTYMNLTANNQSLIDNLDWNTSRNSAEIDINITLPSQEPAGNKSADIILWFEQN
ncbi:MAG: NosD domain-containing protein [Nanoarchaeota archaeon]